MADATADPYRWLEDLDGGETAAWVLARNAETVETLATGERFDRLRQEIREVLDSEDRVPLPTWRGEYLYNLWKDREHPRGLWRRTTLAEYRKEKPDWQILLDVDDLAA